MAEVTEATVLRRRARGARAAQGPRRRRGHDGDRVARLDIDSLELVELVTALEDRFDVKIADGELKSIAGVGDAVRITLALANEPASGVSVAVTGRGVVTSLGEGADAFLRGAGRRRLGIVDGSHGERLRPRALLDPRVARRTDRYAQFGVAAATRLRPRRRSATATPTASR